jgi:hypothetical protein
MLRTRFLVNSGMYETNCKPRMYENMWELCSLLEMGTDREQLH